jgi:hypothetical protein
VSPTSIVTEDGLKVVPEVMTVVVSADAGAENASDRKKTAKTSSRQRIFHSYRGAG